MLALEEVHKRFVSPDGRSQIPVLTGVSLKVLPGETLAIVGPSGSGKSTLLSLMGGLDVPSRGRVLLHDRDLAALSEQERARVRSRHVGFVFQLHHLLPQCTVWENVLVPTLALRSLRRRSAGGAGSRQSGAAGTPAANAAGREDHIEDPTARARRLLERVGLIDRLGHRPAELSGGECLRAAVARALINRPALLLADEPTGSLDTDSSARLAELLMELNLEEGVSLIVVTHSDALASRLGRRLRLSRGVLEG